MQALKLEVEAQTLPSHEMLNLLERAVSQEEGEADRTARFLAHSLDEGRAALVAIRQELSRGGGPVIDATLARDLASLTAPTLEATDRDAHGRRARLALLNERRQATAVVARRLERADGEIDHFVTEVMRLSARVAELLETAKPSSDAAVPPPAPIVAFPAAKAAEVDSKIQRRQSRRTPLNASVTFESENNFYTGFSTDISEGGIFLATVDLLEQGEEVNLEIDMPDGSRISCLGEVRWVREWNPAMPEMHPGMGVQFRELDPAIRARVTEFVAQREPIFLAE